MQILFIKLLEAIHLAKLFRHIRELLELIQEYHFTIMPDLTEFGL